MRRQVDADIAKQINQAATRIFSDPWLADRYPFFSGLKAIVANKIAKGMIGTPKNARSIKTTTVTGWYLTHATTTAVTAVQSMICEMLNWNFFFVNRSSTWALSFSISLNQRWHLNLRGWRSHRPTNDWNHAVAAEWLTIGKRVFRNSRAFPWYARHGH